MSDLSHLFTPARLRSERERLGYKLNEFAELMGITRQTQAKYEKLTRSPDSDYLEKASKLGIDVFYLITGTRLTSQPGFKAQLDSGKTIKDVVADLLENLPEPRSDLETDQFSVEVKATKEKSVGYSKSDQKSENGSDDPIREVRIGSEFSPAELGDIGEKWWDAVSYLSEPQREAILTLVFNHVIAKFIEINKDNQGLVKHKRSRSLTELLSEPNERRSEKK